MKVFLRNASDFGWWQNWKIRSEAAREAPCRPQLSCDLLLRGIEVLRFALQIAGGRGGAFGAAPAGPNAFAGGCASCTKGRERSAHWREAVWFKLSG